MSSGVDGDGDGDNQFRQAAAGRRFGDPLEAGPKHFHVPVNSAIHPFIFHGRRSSLLPRPQQTAAVKPQLSAGNFNNKIHKLNQKLKKTNGNGRGRGERWGSGSGLSCMAVAEEQVKDVRFKFGFDHPG